jgi:hypothetical protein
MKFTICISNLLPKDKQVSPSLNPQIVLVSLIIKHMCNLVDRETVDHISESIDMQYFLGYQSFTNESPFDVSLFVEFRNRLGLVNLIAINEKMNG